jgi:hypothetical protein
VTAVREPAWLTAAVDQRLAMMFEIMDASLLDDLTILFTFLTEPVEGAGPLEMAYWEHACDNCGKFSKDEVLTGTVERVFEGHKVLVQFGACPTCRTAA